MPYHMTIYFCDERYREGLALEARSAAMMNCSVSLLIARVLNAATVTSIIAVTSAAVSLLMTIFGFMWFLFVFLANFMLGIKKDNDLLAPQVRTFTRSYPHGGGLDWSLDVRPEIKTAS